MINKVALAGLAAALIITGSMSAARADMMINDTNSGLPTMYYNGTLADLSAQGLPLSDSAKQYLKQHSAPRAAAAGRHGSVYLLEDRGVFGSGAIYQENDTGQDHKQDGHW